MKSKILKIFTLLLCFLLILPSCESALPDESNSDSTAISTGTETEKETEDQTEKVEESEVSETESESQAEWETMMYPDADDNDPDLESADYSKLVFCSEILTYSGDLQLSVLKSKDAIVMKELVEAKESEWKKVTSYDEGLALLKEIIADSQNQECTLMVIVEYTSEDGPWVFSVNNHYKARHELEYSNGEKKLIWVYSKEWIESGFTPSPEKLMETFERYTMYSDFSRIVISAVPIPAEN